MANEMANEGALAEHVVGQALRIVDPPFHGDRATYEPVSLPLYLAANVGRILRNGQRQPRKK